MDFLGTHPGDANGPLQWANHKLFDPPKLLPYGNNEGGEFLGFSEQARRWVKKSVQRREKGLCKGLSLFFGIQERCEVNGLLVWATAPQGLNEAIEVMGSDF
jgi:hypothetical protein